MAKSRPVTLKQDRTRRSGHRGAADTQDLDPQAVMRRPDYLAAYRRERSLFLEIWTPARLVQLGASESEIDWQRAGASLSVEETP